MYDGPGPASPTQYVSTFGGIVHPMCMKLNKIDSPHECAPSSFPVITTPATFPYKGYWPNSLRSLYVPSSRSITRDATLERCPNQIGVPTTMMSAALILSKIPGHSSPSPSSDVTPSGTLKSTTRITSLVTSSASNHSITLSISACVLETSGDFFSVQ